MSNSIAGKLIKIVKTYPVLYNPNDEDYRSKEVVDPLWQSIAEELNESDMELRKRWRNLRDTYVKLLRLVKNSEKDEVFKAAAVRKYYKWIWTREMEFFRPYLTYGNKLDQLNLNIQDIESLNEEPNLNKETENVKGTEHAKEVEENPKRPTRSVVKRKLIKKETAPTLPAVRKTASLSSFAHTPSTANISKIRKLEKPRTMPTSDLELDATDRLFLAHAQNIKQFSARRQALTKLKIAEVIMEQEILHEEDMDLASISTATANNVRRRREETPPVFETVCGYNSDDEDGISYVVTKNETNDINPVEDME